MMQSAARHPAGCGIIQAVPAHSRLGRSAVSQAFDLSAKNKKAFQLDWLSICLRTLPFMLLFLRFLKDGTGGRIRYMSLIATFFTKPYVAG